MVSSLHGNASVDRNYSVSNQKSISFAFLYFFSSKSSKEKKTITSQKLQINRRMHLFRSGRREIHAIQTRNNATRVHITQTLSHARFIFRQNRRESRAVL